VGNVPANAMIRVTRMGGMFRDFLRAYKLLVDGEVRGRVRPRKSVEVEVEPGPHEVRMKIDWTGSPTHTVDLRAGETAHFVCWANTDPGQIPDEVEGFGEQMAAANIGAITVGKDVYIGLAQTSADAQSADRA
jgi:hypothetical protein